MDIRSVVRSPSGRGIRSEEFWRLPVSGKLLLLAVLFLPFQYGLTLDLGFPLKISEVLVAGAILTRLVNIRRDPWVWSRDQWIAVAVASGVVLSTLIAALTMDRDQVVPGITRPLMLDLLMYCGYGLFALAFWLLLRTCTSVLIRDTLIQSLWLCFASVIFQAIFLTLKMPEVLQSVGFFASWRGQAIFGLYLGRSGPFLEGQHLGFYAGALFVIALYARRYVAAFAAIACVVYSQSTTGFLGIALAILVASLIRPTKAILIALGSAAAIGIALFAVVKSFRDALLFQLAKLGLVTLDSNIDYTRSLELRLEKTRIGWQMMWDNPLGVGPGRYAANFQTYQPDYEKLMSRPIAENVYLHLGAENGLLALAAFGVLLVWLLVKATRIGAGAIALTVFVAVGVATQSSWTFMPIWGFLALLASEASPMARRETDAKPDAAELPPLAEASKIPQPGSDD